MILVFIGLVVTLLGFAPALFAAAADMIYSRHDEGQMFFRVFDNSSPGPIAAMRIIGMVILATGLGLCFSRRRDPA